MMSSLASYWIPVGISTASISFGLVYLLAMLRRSFSTPSSSERETARSPDNSASPTWQLKSYGQVSYVGCRKCRRCYPVYGVNGYPTEDREEGGYVVWMDGPSMSPGSISFWC